MKLPVQLEHVTRASKYGHLFHGITPAAWDCPCRGECYDGSFRSATGGGASIATAISHCESQLRVACLGQEGGGLRTYSGGVCSER